MNTPRWYYYLTLVTPSSLQPPTPLPPPPPPSSPPPLQLRMLVPRVLTVEYRRPFPGERPYRPPIVVVRPWNTQEICYINVITTATTCNHAIPVCAVIFFIYSRLCIFLLSCSLKCPFLCHNVSQICPGKAAGFFWMCDAHFFYLYGITYRMSFVIHVWQYNAMSLRCLCFFFVFCSWMIVYAVCKVFCFCLLLI